MKNPLEHFIDWLKSELNIKSEIFDYNHNYERNNSNYNLLHIKIQDGQIIEITNSKNTMNLKNNESSILKKLSELNLLSSISKTDILFSNNNIAVLKEIKSPRNITVNITDKSIDLSALIKLERLTLYINNESKDITLPENITNLSIILSDSSIETDIQKIIQINNLKKLEQLNMSGNINKTFFDLIKNNQTIKQLYILENTSSNLKKTNNELQSVVTTEKKANLENFDLSTLSNLNKLQIFNLRSTNSIIQRKYINLTIPNNLLHLSILGLNIKKHNIPKSKNIENILINFSILYDEDISNFFNLKKIKIISINNTPIKIDKYITNNSIIDLDITNSNLKNIDFISNLTKLTLFNASHNQIESIPNEVPASVKLLNVSHCNIINLSKEVLVNFVPYIDDTDPNLVNTIDSTERNIIVTGNPLQNPPVEIIAQGKEAVGEYISSMEGDTTTLNEAKIIFVGDGAAGKTSLMKRLVSNDFDEEESQTDGIEIMNYKVHLENECCINAAIWDFGGQQILQATHQLFLSKRSIYVLVVEDRKNDLHKDQDIEQWLTQINSLGGKPPVLVVKNKIDENPHSDIQTNRLKQKFPNIVGFHEISCREETGLDKLSSALDQCIIDLPMRKLELPQNWLNVKNELKLQAKNHDLLHLSTYQEICVTNNIKNKTAKDILLRLLHDLGEVIAFEELKQHNTAILEPTWITEGIYGLIRSETLANNNGVITLADAQIALDNYSDKPERFENKAAYILDAMKTFQLCHRTMETDTYLIPTLLPPQIDTSTLDQDFKDEDSIRFIFKFEKLLPPSLMPMLLVKIHEWIYGDKRWRTGAILTPSHFKAQAKLELAKVERELYIQIIGNDKRDLFIHLRSIINELIDKLASKNAIGLQELIPLGDSNESVGYTELIGLKSMGESSYLSGKLGRPFNINELLGEIEAPQDTNKAIQTLLESHPNANGLINIMHNENINTNSATGGSVTNANTSSNNQEQVTDVTATATSTAEIKQELRAFKGQSEFILEDIEEEIEGLTDSDRKLKEFAKKECEKVTQAINALEADVEDQESADNNLKHFSRVQNFLEGALQKTNSVGKVIDQAGNLYSQVESLATKYNDIATKFAMPVATILGLS